MQRTKRRCDEAVKSAIWDVLSGCYGIDHAISADRLKLALNFAYTGKLIRSREIRNCISEMRKEGNLICSMSGTDDEHKNVAGYYLPATMDEYLAYRRFYVSYANDIYDTIRSMDKEAKLTFEFDYQPSLFADIPEEKLEEK